MFEHAAARWTTQYAAMRMRVTASERWWYKVVRALLLADA